MNLFLILVAIIYFCICFLFGYYKKDIFAFFKRKRKINRIVKKRYKGNLLQFHKKLRRFAGDKDYLVFLEHQEKYHPRPIYKNPLEK